MRSEVVIVLTGSSDSDSEVANRSTEEFDIGVVAAEPVKRVRVWSSYRAIRVQLVLMSQVVRRIQLLWHQPMRKILSIFTQKYHHSKHGVHFCYINFSPTMNFIHNYIIIYIIYYIIYIYIILYIFILYYIYLYQIEGNVIVFLMVHFSMFLSR